MSDEKTDAVSPIVPGYKVALATLLTPATHASSAARSIRGATTSARVFLCFFPFALFVVAVFELWLAWHGGQWTIFWITTGAGFLLALSSAQQNTRMEAEARKSLQIYKGIQALRQVASAGDNRLAPTSGTSDRLGQDDTRAGEESGSAAVVGPMHLPDAFPNSSLLFIMGLFILVVAPSQIILFDRWVSPQDSVFQYPDILFVGVLTLLGTLCIVVALQSLRSFTITADEHGFQWQRPALRVWRRTVRAPWKDVRAFTMVRARKSGKSAEMDEDFLLDATSESLAWRITPKTPASVREAHERFVHMANEHVQLRDITTALKNLLGAPETRSYEYAVIALSGKTPVPPAVRKVLTTPVRESHFLRGYLIVAAILLGLLIAAGLLLQTGVIPAATH